MTRSHLPVAVLALAAAALTLAAGAVLFSAFMLYDDEGYVLFSIKNFIDHGGLYRSVYSQYGPFIYVFYEALHSLGMPITHTAGRLITLAEWSGAATLAAGLVWRATRNLPCSLATLAGTFIYLWIMVSEPAHPGGLIAFATASMAALGYTALASDQRARWALGTGVGIAALVLTKINVGAFAALAAGSIWLLDHRSRPTRSWAPWAVAAALAALPFGLMQSLLGTPWVDTFAALFVLAAVPAVAAAARGFSGRFAGREAWLAIFAAGSVAIAICAGVLSRGTTASDLLGGVILGPLRHPGHFSLIYPWPPGALVTSAISFVLFICAVAFSRKPAARKFVDTGVALLRLAAAAGVVAAVLSFPNASPDRIIMSFASPFLWPLLWPLESRRTDDGNANVARTWVGLLYLIQWLHAYPVPGSQMAWGTFLFIPLAAIGAWEAARWLAPEVPPRDPSAAASPAIRDGRLRQWTAAVSLALVGFAGYVGIRFAEVGRRYAQSRDLDLPGAESLRLPDSTTVLYRMLCLNAAAHADVLFSLPGMFSFNLWTSLPAPTLANVTHWFSLLDSDQQQAIQRSLQSHPRSCVIVQRTHLDFLREHKISIGGPLADYLHLNYEPAFTFQDCDFLVRRGRTIFAFNTGELFRPRQGADSKAPACLLKLHVLLPPESTVATVQFEPMDGYPGPVESLRAGRCRVDVTSVNLRGEATRPTVVTSLPIVLTGPSAVDLYFDPEGPLPPAAHACVAILDASGREIALLGVLP